MLLVAMLLLVMLLQPLYVAVAAAEINICTQNAIFQAFPLLFGGPSGTSWMLSLVRAAVAVAHVHASHFRFLPTQNSRTRETIAHNPEPKNPKTQTPTILSFSIFPA